MCQHQKAQGTVTLLAGLGLCWERLAADASLGPCDELGQGNFKGSRELEQVAVARVSQPALDLADVSAMHPGKVSKSLLRESLNFPSPRAYRFAKSLESRLRHGAEPASYFSMSLQNISS